MADCYFNAGAFAALPRTPTTLTAHGGWVTVRSSESGVVQDIAHERLAAIRALPSLLDEYLDQKAFTPGARVATTIDVAKIYGGFSLANTDPAQLAADYEVVQRLVDEGLFVFAPEGN